MFLARPFVAASVLGFAAAALSSASDANAQQIYKIIGPDGRVTFSDKAPLQPNANVNAKATAAPVIAVSSGGGVNLNGVPFEVRQAVGRYPVTLYTAANCSTCTAGRFMLMSRGIPFAEKTISTGEDFEALKRLSGGNSVPFMTVGSQQLKGFGESEWSEFLDAAGYPKTSQLPPGYTPNAAAPMVALDQARPASAASSAAQARRPAPAAAEAPQTPPAENPAGIRF